MKLLTEGNYKLGRMLCYSIPAIATCPGRSRLCENLCYATEGFFKWYAGRYVANHKLFKRGSKLWVRRMNAELVASSIDTVRVHVSGDFDSRKYIAAWKAVAEANPNKYFFAYTRSWRIAKLLNKLIELSKLPNFTLNLSCDAETKIPRKLARDNKLRLCYMSTSDTDKPSSKVGIVFRTEVKTVLKKFNGQVCPYEVGLPKIKKYVTCEKCRLCIDKV